MSHIQKGLTQRRGGVWYTHWVQGRKKGLDSPRISPIMKMRQMTEAMHNLFLATFFSRSRSSCAWLLSWQCLMAAVPSSCVSIWGESLQRTYKDWFDLYLTRKSQSHTSLPSYVEIMFSKSSESSKSLAFILVISPKAISSWVVCQNSGLKIILTSHWMGRGRTAALPLTCQVLLVQGSMSAHKLSLFKCVTFS